MDRKSLYEFLVKYSENRYSEQEHRLFIEFLSDSSVEEVQEIMDLYEKINRANDNLEGVDSSELVQKIESRIDRISFNYTPKDEPDKERNMWKAITVAALVIIISAFSVLLITPPREKQEISKVIKGKYKNDICPGRNKATLTMADGSKIYLDEVEDGEELLQGEISIRKIAKGELVYNASKAHKNSRTAYNTITTPRGGQYKVILPDGSKVWLNAASSLKYPTYFKGNERLVQLSGEAYFEIAKYKALPFKVISENQTVEVLGTHFNINAYPDESSKITTLLEGSIKVSQLAHSGNNAKVLKTQLLAPGQKAKIDHDLRVTNADPELAIAWRNGYFMFSQESIQSIMRKISRWYDVEIIFEGNITKEQFVGKVSRYENVSEVLNILELTDLVHFRIEGRRIVVMP